MYHVYYGDKPLHLINTDDIIYDAVLTCEVNASPYFDFSITRKHSLYYELQERGESVYVYADDELLFEGYIESMEDNIYGERAIACNGVMTYLQDSIVRPYSTVADEQPLTAPSSVDGYFVWLIDQHNQHVRDGRKQFNVGINEGSVLDDNNYILRESSQCPTTGDEIQEKILTELGGYLTLTYDEGVPTLNLFSETTGVNTQIVDFGVNVTDLNVKIDTSEQYTAIRPSGKKELEEGEEEDEYDLSDEVTIESIKNGTLDDEDLVKDDDVVYSTSAVAQYGYRETSYDDEDATTPQGVLSAGVRKLYQVMHPTTTVEANAVDASLYDSRYTHLVPGQFARVRAEAFGIDEYMMVSAIDLDLDSPENTTYTFGTTYDTLTGQQSSFVNQLNASINSQIEIVDNLSDDLKDAALAAANAEELARAAWELAQTIDLSGTHVHIMYSEYPDGYQPGLGTWADVKAAVGTWGQAKYYTWSEVGASMSPVPTDDTIYIGICTNDSEEAPYDPAEYAWSKIKGDDGIQGKDGADGTSSWLHIKYSDYPDGFDEEGNPSMRETAGPYIGTCVTQEEADPDDPLLYQWVKIEGQDGEDGTSVTILGSYDSLEELEEAHPTGELGDGYLIDGDLYVWTGDKWEDVGTIQGPAGETTYLHVAYANSEDGTVDFSLTDSDRIYMGTYTDFYEYASTDPERYTWIKVKGDDGEQGISVVSVTRYYLAASVDSGVTNEWPGFTEDMQAMTEVMRYLWSYDETLFSDGTTEKTNAVIIGVYGEKGEDGGAVLYATCETASTTSAKVATLKTGSLTLEAGATVSVTFTYSNTANNPTLNIDSTGAIEIVTNGMPVAYWDEGSTIVFTYDGSRWQAASTPVYASEVNVGNIAEQHVHIDADSIDIVDGDTELATFTGSEIHLGENSDDSWIYFAGDQSHIVQYMADGGYINETWFYVNDCLRVTDRDPGTSGSGSRGVYLSPEGYIECSPGNYDGDSYVQAKNADGYRLQLTAPAGTYSHQVGIYDPINDTWPLTHDENNMYSYYGGTGTSSRSILRGGWIVIRPNSAKSTSSTGYVFGINASTSNDSLSSNVNQLLRGGADSTSTFIQSYATYNRTSSSSANVYITSSGAFARYQSSSARYKHDINYLTNIGNASEAGLDKQPDAKVIPLDNIPAVEEEGEVHIREAEEAEKDMRSILDLPVVQYHFNDGYFVGEPEYDYSKWVTGFVAEDVEKIIPEAVEYQREEREEDGVLSEVKTDIPEDWNMKVLFPRLVYVVQKQAEQIASLEERLAKLEAANGC